jgi:hypothetical protein
MVRGMGDANLAIGVDVASEELAEPSLTRP